MKLLAPLFGSSFKAGAPGPTSNFWYEPLGSVSQTGLRISPETSLRAGAVWACVSVLSETIAGLPLVMFERDGPRTKNRASNHPLFDLLHDQPNEWQTAFEFWQLATVFLGLWGNFYAEIVPGRRGFAHQLLPLHTDRVRVKQLPNKRLVFEVRELDGQRRTLMQEQVFRLHGMSLEAPGGLIGVVGLQTVLVARDIVGLALAGDGYAARLFSNDARPGVVLEHPGVLGKEAKDNIRNSWNEAHAGIANAHKAEVLEEGMKVHEVGMSARDAQMVDSRKFQAVEICRIWRIPPHKIGILDRATFSNIEHQSIEFVTDTILPWCRRIEQAIRRDLIMAKDRFFARFVLQGLLRGDAKTRSEFYSSAITAGYMTRNEARELEDLNPLKGLDEPLSPLNMRQGENAPQGDEASAPGLLASPPSPLSTSWRGGGRQRLTQMVKDAAARLSRKEIQRLAKIGERCVDDPEKWENEVHAFFESHATEVAETLRLAQVPASESCTGAAKRVVADGLDILQTWETERAAELVALTTEEAA